MGASLFKVHTAFKNPLIAKTSDYAAFWTENAVHYRWAKMVAEGQSITERDTRIQHPEGILPFQDETPFMDWLVGTTYRVLKIKMPFHHFVILFHSYFSSLVIFPLFMVVYSLSRNRWLGLVCAALFVFSIAHLSSIASGSIPREIFALVFIFFQFAFLILAINEQRLRWAILSGIFLFISLFAWHVSQFYYALLILFMFGTLLRTPSKGNVPFCFAIQILFALLAGMTQPHLIKGGFLASYAATLSYVFLIGLYWLPQNWNLLTKRISLIAGACFLIFLFSLFQSSHASEFSHVYAFLKGKILHLGIKPTLPGALSYEANVMWMSSFATPSLKTIWSFFGVIPLLIIPGIIGSIQQYRNKELTLDKIMLLYFFVSFIFFYWLMVRMDCFLVFFSIALIGILPNLPHPFTHKRLITLLLILVCGLSFNLYKLSHSRIRQVTPPVPTLLDLLRKVESLTQKEGPIVPPFFMGPSIAAFTDRPVVLHSKFENGTIRRKVKEFEEGHFTDEETFHQLCNKYGARYLIIDSGAMLDLAQDSLRYRTNNLLMNKEMVLYQLHFDPITLKHFQLLYSNKDYRLFEILEKGEKPHFKLPVQPPVYDFRNFKAKEILLQE